jgi:hypothetical protein
MKLSFNSFFSSFFLHLFLATLFLLQDYIYLEKPSLHKSNKEIYLVDTILRTHKFDTIKPLQRQKKVYDEPQENRTSNVDVVGETSFIPDGFIYPVIESFTKPDYPLDLSNKKQGSVELKLLVLKNGSVVLKEILNSTHIAFTESVKKIINSIRFKPGMIGPNAVDTIIIYKFHFKFES